MIAVGVPLGGYAAVQPTQPYTGISPMVPNTSIPVQPQQQQSNGVGVGDLKGVGNLVDTGGITSAINEFGYDVFGIGNKVAGPFTGTTGFNEGVVGGIGDNIAGSFNFTNLAAGIGGNLAADALGLSGEYSGIGSTIGGGIAAAAGLGPVGLFAGSFLGSAFGGLFGGSRAHPASTTSSAYGMTPTGTFQVGTDPQDKFWHEEGGHIGSKHLDNEFGLYMRDSVQTFHNKLHEYTGMDFSQGQFVAAGHNDGLTFLTLDSPPQPGAGYKPDQVFSFDPEDPQDQIRAFYDYANAMHDQYGEGIEKDKMVAGINQALSEMFGGQQGASGGGQRQYTRPDMFISGRKDLGNQTFNEFLTEYRSNRNATTV